MDFVSPIIGPIVQSLLDSIKRHLGFLVSSTHNVKEMDDRMKELQVIAKEVQDKRDRADENTEVVPERVELWLKNVKSLNERSNLVEATKCFNVTKRYKAGKESYNILEEIKFLKTRESEIKFTAAQKPLAEVGSTSTGPSTSSLAPMDAQNNFESRVLIFNDALQALQSNTESQRMIALCGMGGVGKTTMMEQLKKSVEDSKMFDLVVKVVIGETNDLIYIQKAIAEYIGCKLDETTKVARADRLHKIFEVKSQGQKKVLVIMDDLWKELELADVGLSPLPTGFKLLFTSRSKDVCTQMGVGLDSIFNVDVLKNTEAEALFSKIVGPHPSKGDDDELQMIRKNIVKRCGYLPIAIVTIAKILRGKKMEAWKMAHSNLQHHDLQNLEDIVHKVFEMSYNNLNKKEDKAIFLLGGLFPDDFNIPIEDLMMYGWGLKLFNEVRTLREARIQADLCIDNLICANLLTKSDVNGCVKMHDLARAFVLSNFSKVKQASIVNQDNMSLERLIKDSCERVLLKCTGMSGFPADFNSPNLSLLILLDGDEFFTFPEDMHKRMKKLEVLSYENMGVPRLPITFEHSTTLRTLCIRSCSLTDDISFLGSLLNLETLSLADCNIRRLPSAIGKLKNLRLLDLTGCVDLHIDDGVFQNLNKLEELYMRASIGRPVTFSHANCDELQKLSRVLFALELEFFDNKLLPKNMSFKNLERFRISIGCELKNSEKYSFRNTLNLVAECAELNECNIGDLFKNTEELRLQVKYMIQLEDVSLHNTFSKLRVLHISKCAELAYLFTVDVANGLNQLELLTISECPLMEALIGENSGVGLVKLKKLNFMFLEDLPKMVSLCNNEVELPEMVELKLVGLPNFTSIYPDSNSNASGRPLFNTEGVILKLEKLDISMMKNLKQIWPCQIFSGEKNDVSMLRQIRVRECDSLINLFPSNPLPLLNHLEEVVVKKCGSLEVLFNIDFESVCEMGKHSRLRRIEVYELKNLKELWRMRGTTDFNFLIDSFKGVKSIEIRYCERFRDIFTPTTVNFDLGALTSYISVGNGGGFEEGDRKNKMIENEQEEVNVTYPSYLLHTCHQLQHLELFNDRRVEEVVFDMDISPSSSRQSATIQQPPQPLLLPHLESISLHGLKKMSHVWKCNNWNNKLLFLHHHHHQPPPPPPPNFLFPFQNLREIYLSTCHKIKYLFSPLMAKYLSNLKRVEIRWCDGIEEVVSSRDDEENTSTATSSHQINNTTSFFPHFDTLKLYQLSCLKRIDGEENTWRDTSISSNTTNIHHHYSFQSGQVILGALCQYPTKIDIRYCGALSSVVPWYVVGQMRRLQELEIEKCRKMTEVFESESSSNNVDEGGVHGTALTTPTLKNIPQLSNLKKVSIIDCELLPHIFTFSTIKTLYHLKELKVKRCEAMQVIVKLEETPSAEEVVVFPHLETLELDALPKLKGFFLGMNEFRWPLLVSVMINDCPQWVGELEAPKIKYIRTGFGKYNLERAGFSFQTTFPTSSSSSDPTCNISKGMPFSFHDLIEINIEKRNVERTAIIPSHAIQQLHKLEQITIRECNGIEEVFEVVALELELEGSGFNESLKIPNLTQLNLSNVWGLKYLWKSCNQRMVLEFPKLTTVEINDCDELEHVFTCSMAGSLVQLQHLHISNCWDIEVIVKEEECDGKANEIMMPRLNSLKLYSLGSLKGFCLGKEAFSLPALNTLEIKECPKFSVFTKGRVVTPELKEIDTSLGMCDVRTGLNYFIETKQEQGHEF